MLATWPFGKWHKDLSRLGEPQCAYGNRTDNHQFARDNAFPKWRGWHAFRRGIATNLHQLGVADKDIQAILRHSNIGITMNIYVKSVAESQVDAMDLLGEEFEKQQVGNPSQQKLQVN